jgi:hypothetical protein
MPDVEDLANRFSYHAPKESQPERYHDIRAEVHAAATVINNRCPESREKSLAITHLEEAVFWANAAIARNE